jgi:hypothetical protein
MSVTVSEPAVKALDDLATAGTVHGDFTASGFKMFDHGSKGTFSRAANGDLRLVYTHRQDTGRTTPDKLTDYEVLRVGAEVYAKSASYKLPAGKTWLRLSSPEAGIQVGVPPTVLGDRPGPDSRRSARCHMGAGRERAQTGWHGRRPENHPELPQRMDRSERQPRR